MIFIFLDDRFQGGKEFMLRLPRSTSGGSSGDGSSGDPGQHFKLDADTR